VGGSPQRRIDESGWGRTRELQIGQDRWLWRGVEEEGGDGAASRKKPGLGMAMAVVAAAGMRC
jgi:hypothetical protein